jgi:HD superfamily phosphohydrolase
MILGQITNKNIKYECIIELINNKESFFDLDKLDYLNRDSMKYNNNFINFDYNNIISGLKIINKNGLYELCHSINNKLEIEKLFEQRFINHDIIYQNLEVKIWELSYLNLLNHNKNKILSIFNNNDFDVSEFCKLKDESFKVIKCDYNIIGNKFEFNDPFIISTHLENTELFCDDFNVNYGAGNMNPIDKINFYDEVDKIIFSHSDVSSNSYKKYEINYHYLYYDNNISNDIKLYEEIYKNLSGLNNSNERLEKL